MDRTGSGWSLWLSDADLLVFYGRSADGGSDPAVRQVRPRSDVWSQLQDAVDRLGGGAHQPARSAVGREGGDEN